MLTSLSMPGFICDKQSQIIGHMETVSVGLVFIAVIEENPDAHRYVVV